MIRLSREQVRRVDQICIEEYGLPGIVLMENAARSAAGAIDSRFDDWADCRREATIVCGGGNNGGDGYAIARHLHDFGWKLSIVALKPVDDLAGDAAIMARVTQRMNIPIRRDLAPIGRSHGGIVIDAITGTGLTRPLAGGAAAAVKAITDSGRLVVAIDLPSGLDCDTGEPLGEVCVRASRTITFVAEKLGFANAESEHFTGTVIVADIGCPREVVAVSNP